MKIQEYSLSADEMALIYSLLNKPEAGKAVLLMTYGQDIVGSTDEKLILTMTGCFELMVCNSSRSRSMRLDFVKMCTGYPYW